MIFQKKKIVPVKKYRIIDQYDWRRKNPIYYIVEQLYLGHKDWKKETWKVCGYWYKGEIWVEYRFNNIESAREHISKRIKQDKFKPEIIEEINAY